MKDFFDFFEKIVKANDKQTENVIITKKNPDKITLVCHHSAKNSINRAFVDTSLVRRRVRTKHCQFKCTPQGNVVPGTFFDQQFYKTFVPQG